MLDRPITLADCYVYHWFDLPCGGVVPGLWDLRPGWRKYLGGVDLAGERVLELGPSSGFLSLKMEEMGAGVTAFELPEGIAPDLMPIPGADMEKVRVDIIEGTRQVRNAWSYFHRLFGSKNRRVSGDIYNLPASLGRFDTTVLGAILLHLRDPFSALLQAARLTEHRIIITEMFQERLGGFMEFDPNHHTLGPCAWWLISPDACRRMLEMAGFPNQTLSFHEHPCHYERDPEKFVRHQCFTIVAER
jgi:hypothetical protein